MESSPLSRPSDRILELEASLEETSRTIQQSKIILASVINPYQSSFTHHNISVQKSELEIKVNINMTVSPITGYNRVLISQIKGSKPCLGDLMINVNKNICERPFVSVATTNIVERQEVGQDLREREKTYSFGSNSDTENQEKGSSAKRESPENNDAIRIIDDQDQSQQEGLVYSESGESGGQTYGQKDPTQAENNPCFGWKMTQKHLDQPCSSTQDFREVKRRLKLSESFTYQSPKKTHTRQGTTSTRSKLKSPSLYTHDPESKYHQGRQTQTQASLSPSQRNASKMQLIKYFSKSPSQKAFFGQIKCDKFRREVQQDRKLRLISQAVKMPGVSRHFSLQQLYDLQTLFSNTKLPEYKWLEFLSQKVRSSTKFQVISPFKYMSS